MSDKVSIAIEKMDKNNLLKKRETIVGIHIVKKVYTEEDIQCLIETIIRELKPALISYLNFD